MEWAISQPKSLKQSTQDGCNIFTTEIINIGSGSVAIRELFNLDWRLSEMQLTVTLTSRSPPSILQTLYGRDFKFHGRAENRREN
jgi:hypothetical protein